MELRTRPARAALLWTLAALIMVADQLTKAWFVYLLGSSRSVRVGFDEFLRGYFSLFAGPGQDHIIHETYGPFFRVIYVWDPWISWRLATNTGAAWSMFAGNSFVLSFVSVAIAALLWWVWRRNFSRHLGMTIAIGAIIGGALGNSIDRFRLREVVDFVAVKIPWIGRIVPGIDDPYDFPIFNVADASAVCGTLALAGYLLWLDIAHMRRRRRERDAEPFRPYPGGLQLDDEALENLRSLDTSSLPPWEPSEEERLAEQEEASRNYVQHRLEQDRNDDLPELTDDFSLTDSARDVLARESEPPGSDAGTAVPPPDSGEASVEPVSPQDGGRRDGS